MPITQGKLKSRLNFDNVNVSREKSVLKNDKTGRKGPWECTLI